MNLSRGQVLAAERVGLLMFFFGLWTTRLIAVPGLLLLLLGLCANFNEIKSRLWSSAPCKLAFLWMLYITFSGLVFTGIYPDYWYVMLNQSLRFIYLGGFILVALGFYRHPNLIWPCIFLSFLGFFLTRLLYVIWLLWEGENIAEGRPALGLHTAIAMGQYSFFAMMALILFFPRFLEQKPRSLGLAVWLVLFIFSCFLILVSQSRSTWFLMPLLLPALVLAMIYIQKLPLRRFVFIGSVIVLAGVVVIQGYSELIFNRMETESETLEQVSAGDIKGITATTQSGQTKSIGVRVVMSRYGFEQWREHPVFGLGPGATKMLLDCCAPEAFKALNDLHSFVPEILLRTGLVGFAILFLLNVTIFRAAFSAYRSGRLPAEILLLIVFGLLLHWGVALGNFRMVNYDWRFYWFMLTGLAAAFSFSEAPYPK